MSLKTMITNSVAAIGSDPSRGQIAFSASGRLTPVAATTEVSVRCRDRELTVDEPKPLGGKDLGANPVEHALIALASCQAITYSFWAARLGVELDIVEVTAEGDLDLRGFLGMDDAIRPGLSMVRLTVSPTGPESAERYRELADAVDAHCPVHDMFSAATPIQREITPVATELAPVE